MMIVIYQTRACSQLIDVHPHVLTLGVRRCWTATLKSGSLAPSNSERMMWTLEYIWSSFHYLFAYISCKEIICGYEIASTGGNIMWLPSVLFQDMIIGGDLNAGCSYFGDSDKETNRLYNDPRFTWLIGDDANTNVASSECPYDRS